MTTKHFKGRWVVLIAATISLALMVTAAVFSSKRRQLNYQEKRVNYMPPVLSKVKRIEIVRAWIEDANTPHAGVAIEVRNNSDLSVMAVDLVSGEGAVTTNGLTDEEHPIVVIRPHGTTKLFMNFGAMTHGKPLVVAAATFSDGSEEGEEASLKAMHKVRAHDRARIKEEKERRAQKGGPTP